VSKNQINIFEAIEQPAFDENNEIKWELPDLRGKVKRISLDTEGELNIWTGGKPCGLSIATEDFKHAWYIPFGHAIGFNFGIENVREWAKENLVDLDIDLLNAKHDFNSLRLIGIDLEAQGNRLHEVMHMPALLFSGRQDYDLDSLLKKELGREKFSVWGGNDYEKLPMRERPSHLIAPYACQDAIDTAELSSVFRPRIDAEALGRVLALEDRLIYAVAHMERQGARIDVDRLQTWQRQIHNRYISLILQIYKLTGLRVEPTKARDLAKLFKHLGLTYSFTPTGEPSITNEVLKAHKKLLPVQLAEEAKQLHSLKTKAIDKFLNSLGDQNILRYALNQLKAVDDNGSNGTVSGRFSSSGGGKYINGVNIQQVMSDEKQEKIPIIADYPIRDLFIPESGYWLSADAKQIEFRLFAHFVETRLGSKKLTNAYRKDPLVDFHDYVKEEILGEAFADMPRKIVKNCNFSKIYGVGIKKLCDAYLHVSYEEGEKISKAFNRAFPEAGQLLQNVADLAKSRDMGIPENRGWVRTILGRKRQFTNADLKYNEATGKRDIPWYAALNAVIQGTAADIMKVKLLELYDTRHETQFNMRFTVHDEVDGDTPDKEHALKVEEILNRPAFPELKVPILWDVVMGSSWKQCEKLEKIAA
jgi:DNA polymerase I-like protein with 3'-5' exonuclease and polymerase domains